MFQLVILLLQVASSVLKYLNDNRLISEGQRRQIEAEMVKAARSAALAMEIRTNVGKLTDDEVDAALRGDYRD